MDEKLIKHEFPGKRGHWTQDEHDRFIEAINKYGKDWKKIVQVVGTRSSNQIRSHAQKYFIKLEKKKQQVQRIAGERQETETVLNQTLLQNHYLRLMYAMFNPFCPYIAPTSIPVKVVIDSDIESEEKIRKHIKVDEGN
jgi:SHAQKYF class myb-like DNA-binding protein